MENCSEIVYALALSRLEGVGDVRARRLINTSGGAEAVFKQPASHLLQIPGIGPELASRILKCDQIEQFDQELTELSSNGGQVIYYQDERYPRRLSQCEDRPLLLFYKGKDVLNSPRMIAVVGTRAATLKGKAIVNELIKDLALYSPVVVSGLAHGIDVQAHKAALENGIDTVGVMATGLDKVYPKVNTLVADQMVQQGGLLTEFPNNTIPDRENFPKRNRIVAGMIDATIVVESSLKGGSLITADLSNSYNRDVYAVPGKPSDKYSTGCNWLIKTQRAALVESADDIALNLGWQLETKKPIQPKLFVDLNEEETKVVDWLKETDTLAMDEISIRLEQPISRVTIMLLELEFKGIIASLPGKQYKLV